MPPPKQPTDRISAATGHEGGKKRRKHLLILAASVVGLVLVLGVLNLRLHQWRGVPHPDPGPEPIQSWLQQADEHKEQGRKAASAHDFKKAEQELKAAKAMLEEVGQDEDPDLQRLLDFAQSRLGAQTTMQVARELADLGELVAAKAELESFLELGDSDSPEEREASELLEDLKKRSPKRVQDGKADPTTKAMETFAAGQLDEAIVLATACDYARCRVLKDKLTAFRGAYANLEGSGNLERAMSIIKTIPGGSSSPYMQRISAMGLRTFVKEGLVAVTGNNYPKAFAAFSKAQGVDPGNEVVMRNLNIIHLKAKELSEQACIDMQQDPNKAYREFGLVLKITANDDDLHRSAKSRLKNLSDPSSNRGQ